MKCSNPDCSRGIGLVSHRRGWFDTQRYCSKRCLDAVASQVTGFRRVSSCDHDPKKAGSDDGGRI
jgi:hypothetical protein